MKLSLKESSDESFHTRDSVYLPPLIAIHSESLDSPDKLEHGAPRDRRECLDLLRVDHYENEHQQAVTPLDTRRWLMFCSEMGEDGVSGGMVADVPTGHVGPLPVPSRLVVGIHIKSHPDILAPFGGFLTRECTFDFEIAVTHKLLDLGVCGGVSLMLNGSFPLDAVDLDFQRRGEHSDLPVMNLYFLDVILVQQLNSVRC